MLRPAAALCSLLLLSWGAHAAPATRDPVSLAYTPCAGMSCIPLTLSDGKTHVLMLDTGNVNSWLLEETARSMGLKLDTIEQPAVDVAGVEQQHVSLAIAQRNGNANHARAGGVGEIDGIASCRCRVRAPREEQEGTECRGGSEHAHLQSSERLEVYGGPGLASLRPSVARPPFGARYQLTQRKKPLRPRDLRGFLFEAWR